MIKFFDDYFISIVGLAICFNIAFVFEDFSNYFAYFTYFNIILLFLLKIKSLKTAKSLCKLYLVFLTIQIIGLLNISTIVSFRNIISAAVVYMFIIELFSFKIKINYNIFYFAYFTTVIVLLIYTVDNIWLKNTTPAIFLFITCIAVIISIYHFNKSKNIIYMFSLIIFITMTVFLSYFHQSRTALLTAVIIFTTFGAFIFLKPNKNTLNYLFSLIIISMFLLTYFYININDFYLYDYFNNYSQELFHKNIDSSRPWLWRESLLILNDWQSYILGAGTGKLPELDGFTNSSFHNTYIQLFIQNGILGLMILILLFRKLWILLTSNELNMLTYFTLSLFIGILVYNCFETTLLQNKTFLGIVEWLALGVGYQYSTKIENFNNK